MDYLISDLVQQMTSWFGFFSQGNDFLSASSAANGNPDYWYLLSSLKWEVMESVTSATLSSPDLRDAFVTFLAGECGDALKRTINQSAYVQAANAGGSRSDVPATVFTGAELNKHESYQTVKKYLSPVSVPIPESLAAFACNGRVLDENEGRMAAPDGSFLKFINANGVESKFPEIKEAASGTGETTSSDGAGWEEFFYGNDGMLRCSEYIETLVHGFRWEAGLIYNQIIRSLPKRPGTDTASMSFTGQDLGRSLFSGWVFAERGAAGPEKVQVPTDDNSTFYPDLLMNLIVVHLFRNEMIAAPRLANTSSVKTSAEKQKNYVEMNLKTVGQKSKAGEFYVWAKMVPYLQGVLLYCLAIAYPFVCVLVLIPGWHKILFTWLSFWVWVKLWDLGFAIVVLLERSVWASFGGGSDASTWWAPIVEMRGWGRVNVDTTAGQATIVSQPFTGYSIASAASGTSGTGSALMDDTTFGQAMGILDHALCSMSINLDLNNAYYIYIMTGLYLAIPAVIGQCVLGAKAGAASLATGIIQPVTEAGKAAASGWQGEKNAHLAANSGSIGQAAYGKALRKNGLALQALNSQNDALVKGIEAQAMGAYAQGYGNLKSSLGNARQVSDSYGQLARQALSSAMNPFAWIPMGVLGKLGTGSSPSTIDSVFQKGFDAMAALSWDKFEGRGGANQGAGGGVGASMPEKLGQLYRKPPRAGGGAGMPGLGGGAAMSGFGRGAGMPGSGGEAGGGSGVSGGSMEAGAGPNMDIGGGAAGQTPSSGAISLFPDFAQGLNLIHPWMTATQSIADLGYQIYNSNMAAGFAKKDAELTGQASNYGIEQFGSGAQQSRYQMMGSRAGEAAGFAGESAVWEAKNSVASMASGELAAMGLNSGTLAPGPKPQGLAMASAGLIDSAATTAWNMPASDGMEKFIEGHHSSLYGAFGAPRIMAAYNDNIQSREKAAQGEVEGLQAFSRDMVDSGQRVGGLVGRQSLPGSLDSAQSGGVTGPVHIELKVGKTPMSAASLEKSKGLLSR